MSSQIQNYTKKTQIGKGANGYVFLVQDEKSNYYALKAQSKITDEEKKLNDYFLSIKFQNIVNTYEQFLYQVSVCQYYCIVMDYCNKGDLYQYLQQYYTELTNQHRKDMLFQIAFGIWEIHQVNIIHRDIKPSNILIHQIDQSNYVLKICDLGLSKTHQFQNLNTMNVGTPFYMAPEQIDQSQKLAIYDKSVDVWAFGALIYDFFSNQQLFYGNGIFEIFNQIKSGVDIQSRLKEKILDQELLEIAISCLQRNPSDRPNIEQILLKLNHNLFQTKQIKFFEENQNFIKQTPTIIQDSNLPISQNQQHSNQNTEQNLIEKSISQIQQNCFQQTISDTQLNQTEQTILQTQENQASEFEVPLQQNKISDSNSNSNSSIQFRQSQNDQQNDETQIKNESLIQQNEQNPNQNIEQDSIENSPLPIQQNQANSQNNQIILSDQKTDSDSTIQLNDKQFKPQNQIKNEVKLKSQIFDKQLIKYLCQKIENGFQKNEVLNHLNQHLIPILEQQLNKQMKNENLDLFKLNLQKN